MKINQTLRGNTCKQPLPFIHLFSTLCIGILMLSFLSFGCSGPKVEKQSQWVGTWSTSPQLVEPHNMPPDPGLANNSLRQKVRVSIGGDTLRVKFSNKFSSKPVTLKKVQIATSIDGSSIDTASIKELTFSGLSEVTMQPDSAIYSDPVAFDLKPRMDLAITIYFGQTSPDVTGHPGSRTTSYLMEGNHVSDAKFTGPETDHWYVINTIEVKAPQNSAAVVTLGNSITDGRGSGTNKQNRWPDILSEQLLTNPQTQHISVLNQGIGGNCVLRQCLGPSALDRFDRDVLKQNGVKWLIILEGVNDLGQTPDSAAAAQTANNLVAAYQQMIQMAHEHDILVYGGTITPFGKSFYHTDFREAARKTVNDWIRNSGQFDAVIDFDKAIRNPQDPSAINEDLHDGDYLHPNEKGHEVMGKAVKPELFY
ncbi:SGNH/GDSL hydrolase family protein [Thermophagus sp. OGC60D27]|uniref:SGNH/GDSL hydrolase family protein n=1 Tax=Thermophagus sp. OGC60D27 TaxID=3458415 RepID=UPI004037E411